MQSGRITDLENGQPYQICWLTNDSQRLLCPGNNSRVGNFLEITIQHPLSQGVN